MSKKQKAVIILHALYMIFVLSYTAHLYPEDCLFESRIAQFFTLSMPIILYWSGFWLFGWGYFGKGYTKVINFFTLCFSRVFKSIKKYFSTQGRLNRKLYILYTIIATLLVILPQLVLTRALTQEIITMETQKTVCINEIPHWVFENHAQENTSVRDYDWEHQAEQKCSRIYDTTGLTRILGLVTILATILYLILILPITVKRCHDLGIPGGWFAWLIILNNIVSLFTTSNVYNLTLTLLITIFGLVLIFKKGDSKTNKFGRPPIK